MFLIKEYLKLDNSSVSREEDPVTKKTNMYLTGVMQRANAKNGNGRIYEKKILLREVENYQIIISEKRALGALDHPNDLEVKLADASHIVEKIWWDNNDVVGRIRLLNTSKGKEAQALIEDGVTLGISSRGLGSLTTEGETTKVNDDFRLICFDLVQEPSTSGAFMIKESRLAIPKSEKIYRLINDIII
jgi:hypothetical protein